MKRIAVVGAGISGLATAYRIEQSLLRAGIEFDLQLFESAAQVGGKIGARRERGYLCEAGPNGFLDSKPSTLDLCIDLGLSDRLQRSHEAARKRFIFHHGRLHALPSTPLSMLVSGLLSPLGKLRLAGELWAPVTAPERDTSIAEFGRRRLGAEACARLLDPMVSGVFAGDVEQLSLKSCFPRIAELEQEHGSLIRALIRLQRQHRRTPGSGPAGPGGTLTSFKEGLSELPLAIARQLGERVHCNAPLQEVRSRQGGYQLVFAGRPAHDCDVLVMATQAADAVAPLRGVDAALSEVLAQFTYAPVTVVGLGYRQQDIQRDLDGFGFLVTSAARRRILGSLWTSSIFPARAPDGSVLLRSLLGGAKAPALAALSADEAVAVVREELADILGIHAQPDFVEVIKWEQAICQYTVGHAGRLQELDARLMHLPGLFLTGNAYRGVALNDCTLNAERVAQQVAAHIRAGKS